jgi:hypothetical protein
VEFGEVLIEDGLVMETEPAGGLAHGESEDGRDIREVTNACAPQ